MRVLVVEDDREVADYVKRGLEEESYSVQVCYDGYSALKTAASSAFDIIVMDIMLPQMDGLEITRRLRRLRVKAPILMLTARDAPQDVVSGLDAGADDYLTKPFSLSVLLARIRARTRVFGTKAGDVLRYADLVMDVERHEVTRGPLPLKLTRTEFLLLECLLRAGGKVVSRNRLLDHVWPDREVSYNNLEVFMSFLRDKVDQTGMKPLIHTERGVGYTLKDY
jgi:two-component system response regulator MprA